MRLSISEVLNRVKNADTIQKKLQLLKTSENMALISVLQYGLHPDAAFDVVLPTNYKLNDKPKGYEDMTLWTEARRLYIFSTTYNRISSKKKTELLLTILENLPSDDATLVLAIINRNFEETTGITSEIVESAFPGLLTPPIGKLENVPVPEKVTKSKKNNKKTATPK